MIEVGEHVRTSKGHIFYIDDKRKIDALKFLNVQYGEIKKHSKNIIDLIEVGDYVNGYQVFFRYKLNERKEEKYINIGRYGNAEMILNNSNIKSIVTHEQFEAMKYKVEDE